MQKYLGGVYMDNYKVTSKMESDDKYQKAKLDMLQALKSYGELSPQQKECLMKEFFGSTKVSIVCAVLNQYFG